jgi:hypothetical protein
MVEENEEHGGAGRRPEGPSERRPLGRSEGDLLAERRAMRATDSGEAALLRRAEAAEATVHTLERHVQTLQQRLSEADDERVRMSELLDAERTVTIEREHELRRVKQREYAEQQLRVEAEERLIGNERESRADLEELARRLSASEREAHGLGERLRDVQRQLSEAEHTAAAERAAAGRSEAEVQARLAALERSAEEIQGGLTRERAARERSELLLESMRAGHRSMEHLIGEMRELISRLVRGVGERQAAAAKAAPSLAGEPRRERTPRAEATAAVAEARGEEMADALAAAVERLRARAQAAPGAPAHVKHAALAPDQPLAPAAPQALAPEPPSPAPQPPEAPERPATGRATEPPAWVRPETARGGERRAEERPERAGAPSETGGRGEAGPASAAQDAADTAAAAGEQPGAALRVPAALVPRPASERAQALAPKRPSHKHSMSLIGRIRLWRKQRRGR